MLEVEGTAAAVGRCDGVVAGAAAAAVVLDLQRAACEKGPDLAQHGIGGTSSTPSSSSSSSSTSSCGSSHGEVLGFFPETPLRRGAAVSPICGSCGASRATASCDCPVPRLPLLDLSESEACSGHSSLPSTRQDDAAGEVQPCPPDETLVAARAEEAALSTAARDGEARSASADHNAAERAAHSHTPPAEGLGNSPPENSAVETQEVQGKPQGAQAEVQGTRSPQQEKQGVPLYVMLPLDVVTKTGELRNPKALAVALQALKSAGVEVRSIALGPHCSKCASLWGCLMARNS